jgi:glyoxylase-like metal-dependent hydrolase (beta-lactamase superfamily II)
MLKIFNNNPLMANSYLYIKGDKALCIDVTSPTHDMVNFLLKNKIGSLCVIFTHAHFDHIIYATPLHNALSRHNIGLQFLAHTAERLWYLEQDFDKYLTMFGLQHSYPSGLKPIAINNFLNDGDSLPMTNFSLIHTPGHSPGSCCLYNAQEEIIFTGDTLFADGGIGRTDLEGGNLNQLKTSLQKIFSLPNTATIYPGHGDSCLLSDTRQYFNV